MTFLFDPVKAMDVLDGFEKGWGGTPQQRMAARYATYAAQYGVRAPAVSEEAAENAAAAQDAPVATPSQPEVSAAQSPPPEPVAEASPTPTPAIVLPSPPPPRVTLPTP
jgi:penicillin-binding protein 2